MSCGMMVWSGLSLVIGLIVIVVTSYYLSLKNSTEPTFDYKAWESWLWFFLLLGVILLLLGIAGFVVAKYPGTCSVQSVTMGSITPQYTAVPGTTGTVGLPYTPAVGSMVQTSI